MVKVSGKPEYDSSTKTVKASLFADSKDEVVDGMSVIGLDSSYTLAAGSSCITADKEFAFLDSEGEWHW